MYFILHPTSIMKEKYYKEDKKHLLVPTKVPHLFKSYDQARNAIERTATFCRKLRKLNLYGGLDQHNNVAVQPLPYITKHYRGQFKRDTVYRYRMHQIALKGGFYGFSPKGLSIVRVVLPSEKVKSKSITPKQMSAITKLTILNTAVRNGWNGMAVRSAVDRLIGHGPDLEPRQILLINRLYASYEKQQRGAGWRNDQPPAHSKTEEKEVPMDTAMFDLSGRCIVKTDDSDDFSSGPANYDTSPAPDPALQAAWDAIEARWYNRFTRFLKRIFPCGMWYS